MKLRAAAVSLLGMVLLAGCGGGGPDAAGPETMSLSISERTLTYPTEACQGPSKYITVYIFGGTPPFKVLDPYPEQNLLTIDTSGLAQRSFAFRHEAGCIGKAPIIVRDASGRVANVELTAQVQPIE